MPKKKKNNALATKKETALTKARDDDLVDENQMVDENLTVSEEGQEEEAVIETVKDAPTKRKSTALQPSKKKAAEVELSEEQEVEQPAKKFKNKKGNALTVKAEKQEEEIEEAAEEEMEAVTAKHLLTIEDRVSHQNLTERSIEIGKALREKLNGSDIDSDKIQDLIDNIKAKTGVPENALTSILGPKKRQFKPPKGNKEFDGKYRKHASGMDELLSTSTVRDLLKGMLKETAKNDEVMEGVRKLVDLMSVVRVPTKYVGLGTKEHAMQHTTAEDGGTGMKGTFEHSRRDEHFDRDKDRRQYVVESMERAVESGKTALEIVIEGVQAAIEATTKFMMAPTYADDVSPYFESEPSKEERREQNAWREKLKEIQQRLSGETEAPLGKKTQKHNALWEGQKPSLQHALSDFRLLPAIELNEEPEANSMIIDPLPVSGLPVSPELEGV
jgi:hypothetical protein